MHGTRDRLLRLILTVGQFRATSTGRGIEVAPAFPDTPNHGAAKASEETLGVGGSVWTVINLLPNQHPETGGEDNP